jgi:hypothetical protein
MLLSLDIKTILLTKPPPSEYAKAKGWVEFQNHPNPMLCMRPVKCRGLPIFLLHPVFAEYLSLSKKVLPPTDKAKIALKAARTLCNTMGNYFENEKTRRSAFSKAIKPLFSEWLAQKEVTAQGSTASTRTDSTISVYGITIVLTEIKNGKNGGDAYMQGSRGYEINTQELSEENPNFLACGAPTFICCLNGQFRLYLNRQ